jgi:hypothetical protein
MGHDRPSAIVSSKASGRCGSFPAGRSALPGYQAYDLWITSPPPMNRRALTVDDHIDARAVEIASSPDEFYSYRIVPGRL